MASSAALAEPLSQERQWIARVVVDGDHAAFAELVRLHQSPLRQFLRRLVGDDHALADDLAQETMLKAWRHIASFRGDGRFLSWLFRIGFQTFADRRRALGQRIDVPIEDEALPVLDEPDRDIDGDRMLRLIDRLQPMERSAMHLHYGQDLSHSEVAATLQLPIGTVKSLIRRARMKLQRACGIDTMETGP